MRPTPIRLMRTGHFIARIIFEGFHIAYVHDGLSADIENQSYETITMEHAVLQIAKSSNKEDSLGGKEKLIMFHE